jgi:hypothetical protein
MAVGFVFLAGCGTHAALDVDAGASAPSVSGADEADAGESPVPPPAPAAVDAGSCPVDGWCWVNPLPQGNSLHAVWAAGPTDAWAVGADGTVVHWDGTTWSLSASSTAAYLDAVWGTSASDVWAVGASGTIIHWDGGHWSSVPSGTSVDLSDLSGSGPDDVWTVGSFDRAQPPTSSDGGFLDPRGYALHWDGKSWSTVSVGTDAYLTGVWASAADDVWAIGSGENYVDNNGYPVNVVVHWDGAQWSEITRLTTSDDYSLTGVWASGPQDVRVYGAHHEYHFDGQAWAPEELGAMPASISRLAGTGPSDVWAVGISLGVESVDVYHFDGASWTKATDGDTPLNSVWATSPANAWAVGFGGEIVHWDGNSWTMADHDLTAGSSTFGSGPVGAAWGSGRDDVWAAIASGGMLHWDGRTWVAAAAGPSGTVAHLWGSGPNDVWGVGWDGGEGVIVHWDGKAWATALREGPSGLTDVWGSGTSDVWAVGGRTFYHWDGATWSLDNTVEGSANSVWGSGPNDVWAAGPGVVFHFDGKAWSSAISDQTRLFGPIWGTSAHDVWLAGQEGIDIGELRHWDGSTWTIVADGPKQVLRSFWGAAADDVWALGAIDDDGNPDDDLALLHFDGKIWTAAAPRSSGFELVVGALWGSGPGDVWAVGGNAILHHAGP